MSWSCSIPFKEVPASRGFLSYKYISKGSLVVLKKKTVVVVTCGELCKVLLCPDWILGLGSV